MRKLSNTEAELKKSVGYKNKRVTQVYLPSHTWHKKNTDEMDVSNITRQKQSSGGVL